MQDLIVKGLVDLERPFLRQAFRLMQMRFEGEPVDLRFLGDKLAAALYDVESQARWIPIKDQVMRARRRDAHRRRKEAKEAKKVSRRTYMRNYMKRYRKRGTTSLRQPLG